MRKKREEPSTDVRLNELEIRISYLTNRITELEQRLPKPINECDIFGPVCEGCDG